MDRLKAVEARLDRYERDLSASRAERCEVTARDKLIPHGLSEAELREVQTVLAAERNLALAELGRKELRYFPDRKLFLLCIRCRRKWHALPNHADEQALVQYLAQTLRLPGRVLVFPPSGGFRSLARKLHQVEGAEVFRRGRD
jgi:hypothetical protein